MNFALIFFISATVFMVVGGMTLLGVMLVERDDPSYEIFSYSSAITIAASIAMVSLGFTSMGY